MIRQWALLLSSRQKPLTTRRFGQVDSITALHSGDQPLLGYHRHPTTATGPLRFSCFYKATVTYMPFSPFNDRLGQEGTGNQPGKQEKRAGRNAWAIMSNGRGVCFALSGRLLHDIVIVK